MLAPTPAVSLRDLQFRPASTTISVRTSMATSNPVPCDGCGQLATSEHITKRLARLEWTTRYRPVHIAAVLLGAAAPVSDSDFLYTPACIFAGEAGRVLDAAGISRNGKSAEAVLIEFQRRGLLLTYVLECPIESTATPEVEELLKKRFPATLVRIRRSLRPKRLAPISRLLEPLLRGPGGPIDVGCPIVLDGERAFSFDDPNADLAILKLRQVLAGAEAAARD